MANAGRAWSRLGATFIDEECDSMQVLHAQVIISHYTLELATRTLAGKPKYRRIIIPKKPPEAVRDDSLISLSPRYPMAYT